MRGSFIFKCAWAPRAHHSSSDIRLREHFKWGGVGMQLGNSAQPGNLSSSIAAGRNNFSNFRVSVRGFGTVAINIPPGLSTRSHSSKTAFYVRQVFKNTRCNKSVKGPGIERKFLPVGMKKTPLNRKFFYEFAYPRQSFFPRHHKPSPGTRHLLAPPRSHQFHI